MIPKYRRHKASGRAVWERDGKREYLPGKYDSPESIAEYGRRIAELGQPTAETILRTTRAVLVEHLVEGFLSYAERRYADAEFGCVRQACIVLLAHEQQTELKNLGPVKLQDLRRQMVGKNWSRQYINHQVIRLRRMVRWGVRNEYCDATVLANLAAVDGLRKGELPGLREAEPVKPVDWSTVEQVLPYVSPTVASMICVQWFSGMRSAELTGLREAELDRSSNVWEYQPAEHKNAWRGKKKIVCFGPQAQALLKPLLGRGAFLFRPAEAMAEHKARRRSERKTPLYGKAKDRQPKETKVSDRYTTAAYQHAVRHGFRRLAAEKAKALGIILDPKAGLKAMLEAAGVAYWNPHRIRHSRATLTRAAYGLEGSQAQLGNTAGSIERYAERSLALARKIAEECG